MLGREGDCDIQVLDPAASRKHACVFELDDGSVLVRDLASQNGTFVDGAPVNEARLGLGDSFKIGQHDFELTEEDESAMSEEFEVKLMSGPAAQETTEGTLDRALLAKLLAEKKKAKEAKPCCGSPLAERARKEGWAHCPACGKSPS